jgi:hypothetical protein
MTIMVELIEVVKTKTLLAVTTFHQRHFIATFAVIGQISEAELDEIFWFLVLVAAAMP